MTNIPTVAKEASHYLNLGIAIAELACEQMSPDEAARLSQLSLPELAHLLQNAASRVSAAVVPDSERPFFSVILPTYNEEENIPHVVARLVPVLEAYGRYEILFVNDGSRDRSRELVLQYRDENPSIKLVDLSRNFGHQAALSAGLAHARGQVIALMDCDLQDPPEVLPTLLEKWHEGYKVVYAIRQKRKESIFKRAAYKLFYQILHSIANIDIPVDSGDFCLMDRQVVDALVALPEKNRFLRGLRSWVGYPQVGVEYERAARFSGTPKYTFSKLMKLAIDGILSFSTMPLRIATYAGFFTASFGFLYLAYVLFMRFVLHNAPPGWASLAALVLLIGGAQLLLIGILGEYIGHIYNESKSRPTFVVARYYD